MDDDNQIAVDIDREFTCFLCNGFITILGSVKVEDHLLILTAANGMILENMAYSNMASVTEEEPPTPHSLFLNKPTRSVYICYLMRKKKLLNFFRQLDLYKEDVRLPAESLGFTSSKMLKQSQSPNSEPVSEGLQTAWESKSRMSRPGGGGVCPVHGMSQSSVHVTRSAHPIIISGRAVLITPTSSYPSNKEAEKISVDQLQSMFPRHSRQALNSALTKAQGDFNLAVTCLLSESEHSNPVAPSHTHPPINTASVQPSVN